MRQKAAALGVKEDDQIQEKMQYLQRMISKRDIEKRNDRCRVLMKENWKLKCFK